MTDYIIIEYDVEMELRSVQIYPNIKKVFEKLQEYKVKNNPIKYVLYSAECILDKS